MYSSRSRDASDSRRVSSVGEQLTDDQWGLLKGGLLVHTYKEKYGNYRRHPDLDSFRGHMLKQVAEHACPAEIFQRLASLEQAFKDSRAR